MSDLNQLTPSSQWHLQNAFGINNQGQIVALAEADVAPLPPAGLGVAFLLSVAATISLWGHRRATER